MDVQTQDPHLRRRGQSLILLLLCFIMVASLFVPPTLIGAAAADRMPAAIGSLICILGYGVGVWTTRRGWVSATGLSLSMLFAVVVVSSSYTGRFDMAGWFMSLSVLIASYAVRPLMIWGVFLVDVALLTAVKLARDGSLLDPGSEVSFYPSIIFLLLVITSTSTLYMYWNAKLFEQRLAAEGLMAQARKEAELARARAERASRAKSTFLANMSHELRTPLNAIIGYSEMLQEEYGSDDGLMGQDLSRIQTAGKHLLGLINDILDLSKVEAGRMSLHAEDFSVASLVSEVCDTIKPSMTVYENTLTVQLAAHLGGMRGDRTKLRQVLINLMANAAKFTERGQVSLRVSLVDRKGVPTLKFEIEDTGIGMSPEVQARVFHEFEQADNSTTRKVGGTGLGLAVCQRLCELMDGEITLVSQEGRGSTFTVYIPRVLRARVPEAALGEEHAQALEYRQSVTRADPSWPHVLVIDDDVATRDYLMRQLVREGFYPVLAASGEEGLARLEQGDIALVILDLLLPGIDGWEVLRQLKATRPELPVVLATIVDERERALGLGASAYLVKPLARQDLFNVLEQLLGEVLGSSDEPVQVLVVEDDEASRSLLRRYLHEQRWAVREAHNGVQAMQRLSESAPQVVLLDLMMPEMDGFDVLDQLRSHEQWRKIPVIIVTAKTLTAEEREHLRQGAAHILHKGAFTQQTLLQEVRRALLH